MSPVTDDGERGSIARWLASADAAASPRGGPAWPSRRSRPIRSPPAPGCGGSCPGLEPRPRRSGAGAGDAEETGPRPLRDRGRAAAHPGRARAGHPSGRGRPTRPPVRRRWRAPGAGPDRGTRVRHRRVPGRRPRRDRRRARSRRGAVPGAQLPRAPRWWSPTPPIPTCSPASSLDSRPPTSSSSIPRAVTRPAARDAASARSRPERDPERWSPPWSYLGSLDHPRVAAKVAPGFGPPPGWEAEWVSVDRTVVECSLASWPLSGVSRRAVVMTPPPPTVVDADPVADLPSCRGDRPLGARARPGGRPSRRGSRHSRPSRGWPPSTPESSWLTGDAPSGSPALRSYLVVTELTGSARQHRRQLADLGVTRLTVKSRDVAAEPRAVLKSLGVTEGPERVLVMTRREGRALSLLTQPAHRPPG